ncbi:oligogalacturonate-specific porin KdgM family protein [Vibrio palustris]|uniref:Oligogalacturonate-specific porin KdgM n=1 Tax=Vibrio palustris TaxID=1918946 RepID=A0A1R4B5X2_9VIBR|nr:oligogalacturonate-specific porin KdgM family protein [Vibrio palustris]SJL84276.1 Oligogalacturonate-specific porin KdgM precursor [Vibrio palustris]
MKIKQLAPAVIFTMVSVSAQASYINFRHEFVPRYDGQSAQQADRIAVGNRFDNGIGFEVEAKWKSQNEDAFGMQTGNGNQVNISYLYHFNEKWSLKPQYKWESKSDSVGHQFNVTLGYQVDKNWGVSFRHRYHYENKQMMGDDTGSDNSHYNRWTFSVSYKGIENFKFTTDVDYTFNPEASGPRWKDHQAWFSEINVKGAYTGFEGNWSPFMELGIKPYASGDYIYHGKASADSWRPRIRIGMKYSF